MGIKGIAAAATLLAAGATLLAGPIAGAAASSPYPGDGAPATATCAPATPAPGGETPSTGPVDQAPTMAPGSGLTTAPVPAQKSQPTRATVPSDRGLTDCSPRTRSAPQVRVRPMGAPQTGDGSLALG